MNKQPSRAHEVTPEQEGDVLGISHSKGRLPVDLKHRERSPQGIEIDSEQDNDALDGSPGYTGTDMGAGGTGNTIKSRR
jgi:hypothetical protein